MLAMVAACERRGNEKERRIVCLSPSDEWSIESTGVRYGAPPAGGNCAASIVGFRILACDEDAVVACI